MNEFAKPGLANDQFPPVSATDNGKVLTVADGKWAVANASGGTTVVANPTLAGTEADLTGLQVGDTKYKIGGSSGGGVLVVTENKETGALDKTWQEIKDAAEAGSLVILLEINPATSAHQYFLTAGHSPFGTENWYVEFLAGPMTLKYKTTNGANDYPVFDDSQ